MYKIFYPNRKKRNEVYDDILLCRKFNFMSASYAHCRVCYHLLCFPECRTIILLRSYIFVDMTPRSL
jgi:hypothetical protein